MEIIRNKFYMPHQSMIFTNKKNIDDFNVSKINTAYKLRNDCLNTDKAIWEIEFHPTNYCNIKCKGCSYWTRHDNHKLSFEYVKEVLDRYKDYDIRSIFFSGGGDPLLWKHWDKFFALNHKDYNYKIGIATNMFNFKQVKDFYDKFDFYQIHVTGYDNDSCFRSTGVKSFDVIDENIKFLLKNKTNEQDIALKILVIPEYYKEVVNFLDYLMDKKANSIVLKFMQNFIKNENILNNEILHDLRNHVTDHKIKENFDFLIDNLNDAVYEKLPMPKKCYFANSGLYRLFNAKGEEYPCICANSNNNEIKDHNNFVDTFTPDMLEKKCPIRACRHYRFSQHIEADLEGKINDDFYFEPMLL